MNKIQIFQNVEFGAIRTMSNEQCETLFCAKDVCHALGYKKVSNAITQHVDADDALKQGTVLTVRLTVTADRDMDFVQLKDERAACMEPMDALSGYRWNNRISYYQETKDASTSFYFDQMRKGKYELEYDVYVTSSGIYQQGVATVRSVYAPEFGGHGKGGRLMVK